MKKVLIIYHSGVGNTKKVAQRIYNKLINNFQLDIYDVEKLPDKIDFNKYDGLIIGFPTIHTHPTKRIMQFIDSCSVLVKPIPTYIFTTCYLYSANTLRIFAKNCVIKNIVPVMSKVYRCAATDGTLVAPFLKILFYDEKKLDDKINASCSDFIYKLENSSSYYPEIPRFKFFGILNYPNKFFGQHITLPIYTHENKCMKCGVCIDRCPASALRKDNLGYPAFISKKCEKCYRCIHHCPNKALSLSKRNSPKRTLGIQNEYNENFS